MARQVGVPYDEVQFLAAGINHCAWFLRFQRGQRDLYPEMRRVMELRYGAEATASGRKSARTPRRHSTRAAWSACGPR